VSKAAVFGVCLRSGLFQTYRREAYMFEAWAMARRTVFAIIDLVLAVRCMAANEFSLLASSLVSPWLSGRPV
jgi:hypothetical protein